jgi:hypothetical protein
MMNGGSVVAVGLTKKRCSIVNASRLQQTKRSVIGYCRVGKGGKIAYDDKISAVYRLCTGLENRR